MIRYIKTFEVIFSTNNLSGMHISTMWHSLNVLKYFCPLSIDWNITEYTPLTVPVEWNSCDVENALSLQENMNREDRLVASRYMLPSVSVMRDRDIAPVVEILDTRSNL